MHLIILGELTIREYISCTVEVPMFVMYTSMYTHGSLFFSTIRLGFMLLTKSTTAGNVMFQYSRLPLVLPPQNYIFENKYTCYNSQYSAIWLYLNPLNVFGVTLAVYRFAGYRLSGHQSSAIARLLCYTDIIFYFKFYFGFMTVIAIYTNDQYIAR